MSNKLSVTFKDSDGNQYDMHGIDISIPADKVAWAMIVERDKEIAELEAFKSVVIPMLDNMLYWETCPEDYKETIFKLLSKQQGDKQ